MYHESHVERRRVLRPALAAYGTCSCLSAVLSDQDRVRFAQHVYRILAPPCR